MSLETLASYPLTSVYHKPPIKPSPKQDVLLFIPGNPGLVEYYITYLNLIQAKHPTFEIYCISHAGYQTTDNFLNEGAKRYPIYNLEFQVNHKLEIINDIVEKDANVYIMAHSVGAYITQRLVKQLQDKVTIKFIGLICPTVINIKESLSGQKLVMLLRFLPVVQLALIFSFLLSFIPDEGVKWIFRNLIFSKPKLDTRDASEALDNSIVASTKLVKSSRIVKQALTMAVEEMEMILDDDEINDWFFKDLTAKGTKIWVYFAFQDHWVHDSTREYILSKYHDELNHNLSFQLGKVDDGITHSFCVDQSVEFSEITLEMMDRWNL